MRKQTDLFIKMKKDLEVIKNNLKRDNKKEEREPIMKNIRTNNVGLAINMVI